MPLNLKNKLVLITAGPTQVPVDDVRVISNIATGETGILLANELIKYGAKVTLVLGPVAGDKEISKNVKIIRYVFFDELKNIITKEVKSGKYDIMAHSAAVSDYRPKVVYDKKIKSGIRNLTLILQPTPKIIEMIKKLEPRIFLLGFKFEPDMAKGALLDVAKELIARSGADLTVANTIKRNKYKAYILHRNKISGPFSGKPQLVKNLIKEIVETQNFASLHISEGKL